MELLALQKALPEIESLGAKLVAVSPEMPDNSLSTAQKDDISFDILYDQGNKVAESFGLVFILDERLRPIYAKFGINLEESNGDNTFTLPIPATYVIKQDHTVAYSFADADYTKRMEPDDIVEVLKRL